MESAPWSDVLAALWTWMSNHATAVTATYAALVATGNLIWTIHRDRRDRAEGKDSFRALAQYLHDQLDDLPENLRHASEYEPLRRRAMPWTDHQLDDLTRLGGSLGSAERATTAATSLRRVAACITTVGSDETARTDYCQHRQKALEALRAIASLGGSRPQRDLR